MRYFEKGPARPASRRFPYMDHRTLGELDQIEANRRKKIAASKPKSKFCSYCNGESIRWRIGTCPDCGNTGLAKFVKASA